MLKRNHTWLFIMLTAACLSCSCNHTDPSEYEKESGIAIPAGAVEKESYDDKKLVKTSSFHLEENALAVLVSSEQFTPLTKEKLSQYWGMAYLKEKPDFNYLEAAYYKNGISGDLSWMYIADLKSGMLWTEIKYKGKPSY